MNPVTITVTPRSGLSLYWFDETVFAELDDVLLGVKPANEAALLEIVLGFISFAIREGQK